MKTAFRTLLLCAALPMPLAAGTSASYSTEMEIVGMGAGMASTARYSQTAQAGTVAGEAGKAAFAGGTYRNDPGAAGQYYRVLSVGLTPASVTIPESSTVQAHPSALLDDDSRITAEQLFAWSTTVPARSSVNATGLVSAGGYYTNWSFSALAVVEGVSGSLNISVTDANPDNFGPYAADGLPDAWQVSFFGENNPAGAAPGADPDADGQTNLFEYRAQLIPTDPASRFLTSIRLTPAAGEISYGPVKAGSTYAVRYSTNLQTWLPLTSSPPPVTNGETRTVFDAAAPSGARRFYKVDVSR